LRRWITLIFVGWVPPSWCPSGTCLGSRREDFLQPHNAQRGLCHTGAATLPLIRAGENLVRALVGRSSASVVSVRPGDLLGDGPHEGGHFARDRYHDLIDVFAARHQAAVALAEADLGLPANLLDHLGHFFQPQLEVATHLGRVAIGPG